MAYPTPEQIDAAIPTDGEPSRALTNIAVKRISSEGQAAAAKLAGIEEEATKNAPDANLLDRANHTGVQAAASIIDLPDLLSSKVDAESGKGLSDTNFTQAEKDKLALLEDGHFKGVFMGLPALESAYPAGEPGDYAVVDDGVDLTWYQWDSSAWAARQGESTDVTPAQVKAYYESNPDTNAFTDDEKSGLANLLTSNRFTFRRRGTWNAQTNTPELLNGTGVNGDFYVVTAPGTRDFGVGPFNFRVQDWVIYAGGVWQRLTVADQLLDWADIQNRPNIPVMRGSIGAPVPAVRQYLETNQSIPVSTNTQVTNWGDGYDHFGMRVGGNFIVPSWASHARVTCAVSSEYIQTGRFLHVEIRRDNGAVGDGACAGMASSKYPVARADTGIMSVSPGDVFMIVAWHNADTPKSARSGARSMINIELFESV